MKTHFSTRSLRSCARLAALAVMEITLAASGFSPSTQAQTSTAQAPLNPSPPPQAVAAGYTRLAFDEEFTSTNGIDMNDTGEPGFNFYRRRPFGSVEPANFISVSKGVLTLTSSRSSNLGLVSICRKGRGWTGFAATNGAYFEASVSFDPAVRASGWPSFWTMAAEHLYGGVNSNYLEIDFFEYDTLPFKAGGTNTYGGAIHVWTGRTETNNQAHDRFLVKVPESTDWKNSFNTVGTLWVPGAGIDYYFNNTLTTDTNSYREFPRFLIGDSDHMPVILGSDGWPMKVDWVRVWQK